MGLLERDSKTTGRSMNTNRYMFVPPVRFCSRTKYPSLTIVAIAAVAVFLATLLLSAKFSYRHPKRVVVLIVYAVGY